MVKPPKTMQPEAEDIDLEKAGRGSSKAFHEDSFRNYMARKIDSQRKQFGVELPPDPRLMQQQQQQQQPAKRRKLANESPSKKKNVTFAQGVKEHDAPVSTVTNRTKRKKKGAINSILKKLKRRHGGGHKIKVKYRRSSLDDRLEQEEIEIGESSTSSLPVENQPQHSAFTSEGNDYRSSTMDVDDLVAGALEREKREALDLERQYDKENEIAEGGGEDVDEEEEQDEKEQRISTTLRPSPQLRRERPDLFFLGIVVMVNGYTDPDTETIQRMMHKHGGDLEKYETMRITHIIAEQLSMAKANLYKRMRKPRPVVKPSWVVDSVQAGRLLPYGDFLIDEVKDTVTNMKHFFTAANATNSESKPAIRGVAPVVEPPLDKMTMTENNLFDDKDKHNVTELQERDAAMSTPSLTHVPSPTPDEHAKALLPQPEADIQNAEDSARSDEEDACSIHSLISEQPERYHIPSNQEAFHEVAEALGDQTDGQAKLESPSHDPGISLPTKLNHSESNGLQEMAQCSPKGEHQTSPLQPTRSLGKTDEKYINGQIRTVGTDPNFLGSFFSNSRLSFIGSFKQRTKESPRKQSLRTATGETQSFVFHADMDYFFAAVVLRNYPQYQNKPVAISHFGKPGCESGSYQQTNNISTSECATCNYEARKFGIKKGMYLGKARQLCPGLIVLPYDFEGYEEVSEQVAIILQRVASEYDGEVEQVSCDESYVELFFPIGDGVDDPYRRAAEVANALRREILQTTRCTATVGVGPNKLLAKLATDRVKPNGSFVVRNHIELLRNLKLKDLHGIGYSSEQKLAEKGLVSVQDIWDLGDSAENDISRILGPGLGKKILNFCKGEDDRPVKAADRKTIGAECNYGVRFDGPYGVDYMIAGLAKEVHKRMEAVGVRGSRVTLKVKQRKQGARPPPKFLGHGSCHNLSRSRDVANGYTRDWKLIDHVATQIFSEMNVPTDDDIRGMGIVMSKLDSTSAETSAVAQAAQTITKWFGNSNCAHETNAPDSPAREIKETEGAHCPVVETSPALPLLYDAENIAEDQQPRYSQIDKATLSELPPEIQEELRNGSKGLPSAATSEDHGIDGVLNHDIPSLSQDLVQIVQEVEDEPTNGDSPQSSQSFFDVALPPMSQIHLSQVQVLPSPLRNQINSHLAKHRKAAEGVDSKDCTTKKHQKKSTVHDEGNARFRQVSVKRLFRLAAVKTAKDESISASELQHLPLELQLQIANNDNCLIGNLSQKKPVRTNERRGKSSLPRKEISSRRRPDSLPRSRANHLQIERSSSQEEQRAIVPVDSEQADEVHTTSDREEPPKDFYDANVAPLSFFMDENPATSEEALSQVSEFLCICVKERRLYDALLLLRNIKNRKDDWSDSAYQRILSEVDFTCEVVEGYRLDRHGLGLRSLSISS